MSATLGELALRHGLTLHGDPDVRVSRVATLQSAERDALSFLANPKYRKYLADTRAGAVVLDEDSAADCPVPALVSDNPYAAYARIATELYPEPRPPAGVHPDASVHPEADVHEGAYVGPRAVVEEGARLEAGSHVGPGCVVGRGAVVGKDSRLVANVTVCHGVVLGERVLLHPGAVIGADGFGIAREPDGWTKVPQVGSVRVGNDVEIGASTTVDRGAIDDTVIGARCMLAGMVGVVGHLEICDDVVVTGLSMVANSIREPGIYSGGLPTDEARKWRRNSARFRRLDELARRVNALESTLKKSNDGNGSHD